MKQSKLKKIDLPAGIEGVIFDLDGTLADTMPIHYIAWREVAHQYGFHFPEDLFYELAGVPTFKIVSILNEQFKKNMDPNQAHIEKENAFLKRIHEIKPVEAVYQFAADLHNKLPISIGTGGVPDIVHMTLKAIQADHMFDVIVTAHDVQHFKPAPDTFLLCAQKMQVNPTACLVLEDSDLGIQAAKAAQMHFLDVRLFY